MQKITIKNKGLWYPALVEKKTLNSAKQMKRFNNLYPKIYSIENLMLADEKARKGKPNQYGIQYHDRTREANIRALHEMLKNKTYVTSPYTTFTIYEPKERLVFRVPYFPDRIAHHAVMNVLKPIFLSVFTADSYSCIEGKGIHAAGESLKEALLDFDGTQYCLKLDITKFYPNVDHDVLKMLLRKKLKDRDLLWLLNGIIDSAPGIPIGNYISQYFANFYLTPLDRFVKERLRVLHYLRYADDLVILDKSKAHLHAILAEIRAYLRKYLKLEVKSNYQIFPVEVRGIDVLGYVFKHQYVRLRKRNKKNFARAIAKGKNQNSIASHLGWLKHCNGRHLAKKLLHDRL
jgi:RNA-directed DNA polymerase